MQPAVRTADIRTVRAGGFITGILWIGLAARMAGAQSGDVFVVKIPGANMTSSVNLSAANVAATPGQTVDVPLSMACLGTAMPAGFQVDLDYDHQKLTFLSARVGPQLSGANKSLSSSTLPNGDIRLLASGVNLTPISDGVVAYASFTLRASFGSGSTPLNLLHCAAATSMGGALATGCSAATLRSQGCDLNGDGGVDITDLLAVTAEVLGVARPVHDLNQDGAVTVVELQMILNAAMGGACQ